MLFGSTKNSKYKLTNINEVLDPNDPELQNIFTKPRIRKSK